VRNGYDRLRGYTMRRLHGVPVAALPSDENASDALDASNEDKASDASNALLKTQQCETHHTNTGISVRRHRRPRTEAWVMSCNKREGNYARRQSTFEFFGFVS